MTKYKLRKSIHLSAKPDLVAKLERYCHDNEILRNRGEGIVPALGSAVNAILIEYFEGKAKTK